MNAKDNYCIIVVPLLVSFLCFALISCKDNSEKQPEISFNYKSYKDVPGITDDEIRAIEELKEQVKFFNYGTMLSTESLRDNGNNVKGFTALFCEWLSNLFGIPFVPRFYEWDDLIAGLESRKIAFTGELTATEERRKVYSMTDPIALRAIKAFRLADSLSSQYIATERPPRYVFLEGTTTIQQVTDNSKDFEIFLVNSHEEAYEMLKQQKVDVFFEESAAEAIFDAYRDIIAEDFLPLVYSEVSLTTQTESLKPIISVVQKMLRNGGVEHLSKLYSLGHQEYIKNKLFMRFSEEEREYMRENPVIPFVAQHDEYPVSFYNSYEKKWQGIAFEILEHIEALTGLFFKHAKKIDTSKTYLISGLIPEEDEQERFIYIETSLLKGYYILLSKADYRNISLNDVLYLKVGLTKGRASASQFHKWFPNHSNTVVYETLEDAIDDLKDGKIDLVMTTQRQFLRITNYFELTGYKVNFAFNHPFDITFGVSNKDQILRSIMDKTLAMIEIEEISDRWMHKTYDYRLKLAKMKIPWIIGMSTLVVCLFLITFVFIQNRRKKLQLEYLVKKRTEELNLESNMLATVMNSIPDFIFAKDLNFCYIQCNKSYLAHLGFSREDVIGKNDIDGFKEDPVLVEKNWWVWDRKVINEGRTFIIEERIPGADGTNPLYETVKTPLVLNGKIIGLLGISHDITKRKEMEEAALAASHSKSVFLANMSHEIRTPMNSIVGFSELALSDNVSLKTKDYLSKILENAEWLLQIINDILDISKIEAGQMTLEKIPFDLHGIFARCQTVIAPKTYEKGISLYCYAEPSVGKKLLGDPMRLRQVLINLLSNAVKFTNVGTVKLYSSIKHSTDNSTTIYFEVKDSGIGMKKEQMEKIFEPFVQADNSVTRRYGGTGLGLTITRNIIELMGGHLNVESIPKVGSKFSFELTFDTINAVADMPTKDIVINPSEKPNFNGEVLVCEDNHMNQMVIYEHLERVGIKPVIAENGKLGFDMVFDRMQKGAKLFDLIFMDIQMPVMDGLEAASKIIQLNTGIPIVAMTANVMSNEREIYKTHGMPDCVSKPFSTQELWQCLAKYLVSSGSEANKSRKKSDYDDKLQKQLQLTFVKDNQKKFQEIHDAIVQNDIKLANRLAHTLKSNAGLIGKPFLQKAAADIESLLKKGNNLVTDNALNTLKHELNLVLKELEPLLNETQVPVQNKILNEKEALNLLNQLKPMLANMNPESINLLNEIRSIPGTDELANHIENFDFKPALKILYELEEKWSGHDSSKK